MKDVITLNQESFNKACLELYRKVEDDGYQPDWVIGIASGGVKLLKELQLENREKRLEVNLKRPSTKYKRDMGWIKFLPKIILDNLRRVESYFVEKKTKKSLHKNSNYRDSDKLNNVIAQLESMKCNFSHSKILIVDDAIDSGMTMSVVQQAILLFDSTATVKTAVIVKTLKSQFFKPDFFLFNEVLIRFPWSKDYIK